MLNNAKNQDIGITDAFSYLGDGLKLALSKECRLFVIIPIFINIAVLSLGGYLMVHWILGLLNGYVAGMLPDWLSGAVMWVLGFILTIVAGFIFCFLFSTIATLIASPFYGLLAEKAEKVIRGVDEVTADEGLAGIFKDIPRILMRELRKWMFYLPRLLLCVIISLIPIVNIISPICWFLLAAWMMSVQYMDYAYDNHKISFDQMRKELWHHRLGSFTIGASVSLIMTIPIINLIVPPAAVCAGTKFFVESQKRIDAHNMFGQGQPFNGANSQFSGSNFKGFGADNFAQSRKEASARANQTAVGTNIQHYVGSNEHPSNNQLPKA